LSALSVEQVVARSLRAHALVKPAASIGQAIVAAAGIYGTSPTSHLGLAARLEQYHPADLERERLETRSIVRVPGMRGSAFLAPRELVPAFLGLSRPRTVRRTLAGAGVTDAEQERLAGLIEHILADEPLAGRDIRSRLAADEPGGPLMTLVLRGMAHEGRIVSADPIGGERATAYRYARMADWAPLPTPVPSVEQALAVMAPIWMQAHGPGTVDDLSWWAGVGKRQAKAALLAMDAHQVVVDGLEGEQWATDAVIEEALGAVSPGTVQLLPVWDAWLMARRERSRLLAPADRPYVVDKSGNVANTITLDGRVVGTWDIDAEKLLVHRFADVPLPRIEAAGERLRAQFGWTRLREDSDPRPLDEGGQNAFRAPLR